MVQLLAAGAVEDVLGFVEQRWARAADPSLVRYFVFAVLAAVAPAYSSYFASSMLRCANPLRLFTPPCRRTPVVELSAQ